MKAMDTMDLFVSNDLGFPTGVSQFMLAGESKRGWTTWMTGPIDDRVIAMAPVVLSSLNMNPVSIEADIIVFHIHYIFHMVALLYH